MVASRWSTACSFVASIVLAACGSGSPGSVPAITGTIHGDVYSIGDAISAPVTFIGTTQHGAAILLSSAANACNDATSPPVFHPNQQKILIELFDAAGPTDTTPTAPGTYTIYPGMGQPPERTAALAAAMYDTTCHDIAASNANATTGTVTLSSVSGNVFSGSYDVGLDSGDHITGDFDPEDCPGLQTALTSTATPTCI